MKLKAVKTLSIMSAVSMLLFSSCGLLPQEEEALAPPVMAPEEVEYVTYDVKIGDISNTLSASCTAVSKTQYNLSFSEIGGHLKTVEVGLGDDVVAGQVLATLDTDSLAKNIEIKKIQIERTNLQISNIIEDAKATLAALEANIASAQAKIDEFNLLLEDTTVLTPEEIEEYNTALVAEQGNLSGLESGLATARDNTDPAKNDSVVNINFDLRIQQLELEDMQNTMTKSTITAPTNGKVVFVEEIAIGDYVAARKNVISIADPSNLLLEYSGSKADTLKVGMAATVTIDDVEYVGEVVSTPSSVPEELVELYEDTSLISLQEPPADFEIGDRGNFEVVIEEKTDIVVVPRSAIVSYVGSYYARVLENGVGAERSVEIGITSATEYEIVSGLQEGDVLILN